MKSHAFGQAVRNIQCFKKRLRKEMEKSYKPEEIFEFNLVYCDAMVNRVMERIKSHIPKDINSGDFDKLSHRLRQADFGKLSHRLRWLRIAQPPTSASSVFASTSTVNTILRESFFYFQNGKNFLHLWGYFSF